jgi:hypothetical protein
MAVYGYDGYAGYRDSMELRKNGIFQFFTPIQRLRTFFGFNVQSSTLPPRYLFA